VKSIGLARLTELAASREKPLGLATPTKVDRIGAETPDQSDDCVSNSLGTLIRLIRSCPLPSGKPLRNGKPERLFR
jgi:hypothetical protein